MPDAAFKHFLRRLRCIGQIAEHRTAVRGEFFQIQYLGALFPQCMQQPALAGAGHAADHAPVKTRGQGGEFIDNGAAVGLVAAVELADLPADLHQHMRHRAAAPAAAPAVNQRLPVARPIEHDGADVARNIRADQRGADFFGVERRNLFVDGADAFAFGVVQYRQIDRAGDVVFGELTL